MSVEITANKKQTATEYTGNKIRIPGLYRAIQSPGTFLFLGDGQTRCVLFHTSENEIRTPEIADLVQSYTRLNPGDSITIKITQD